MLIMRSQGTGRRTSFSGFGLNINFHPIKRKRPSYLHGFGQDDTAWNVLNTNDAAQSIDNTSFAPDYTPPPASQDVIPLAPSGPGIAITQQGTVYPAGTESEVYTPGVSTTPVTGTEPVQSVYPATVGLCDPTVCTGVCSADKTQCLASNAPGASTIATAAQTLLPKSPVPTPTPAKGTTPAGTPNPTPGLLDTITNLITKTLMPTTNVGGLPPKAGYVVQRNAATGQYQYVPVSGATTSTSSMLPFILIGGVGIAAIMLLRK